mmetsp:Transcript_102336/g.177558  ORF Transcript_102336/g.177558 Transcript_102336/m.177558 type:complete len:188 (-) Transcript_102336:59-622(-)
MSMLRRAVQRGVLGVRASSTAVVSANVETFSQKVYRWLDVCGFLTRWHSRRAWILDLDPPQRCAAVMITEYERKLVLWLTWVNLAFIPFSLWYWYGQFTHLASKPPIPLMPEYQYLNNRKRDFGNAEIGALLIGMQGWNGAGGRWPDCRECRWLEFECKKICHDRLRAEGRDIIGGRMPRSQTIGFH